MQFKNALVSVSNKEGLVEFLKPMVQKGLRVVSTGGTSKHLKENGIPVVEVSEQTGYPEVMDGRVRTLHPRIHIPLLARKGYEEDSALLKKEKLDVFDLVIVNLYPFEEASKKNLPEEEQIEFIDIGGPSLLRAASKSFDRISVVCDPKDYQWIAEKSELTYEDKKRLAAKVFYHCSSYDAMIANFLGGDEIFEEFSLGGARVSELRYGENAHQKASWFRTKGAKSGLHTSKIIQGKALSYNNILDLEAASSTVRDLQGIAVVGVKHNNPCGAACDKNIFSATQKAVASDPVSIFGGIIAANTEVDGATAELLNGIFLECIVAPSFSAEALKIFEKKKNLRILEWKDLKHSSSGYDVRTVSGGFLVQEEDSKNLWSDQWQVVGAAPNSDIKNDLLFAWSVCAHLKSNAIALASDLQTVGLGMGQVNRVDAVEQSLLRMKKHNSKAQNVVLASDAFFPFPDSIELAAKSGVRWVIQPGGSVKDEEVIAKAKELKVNMVLTGQRHFRH